MNAPVHQNPLRHGDAPSWASAWGVDQYGVWAEFELREVRHRLRWAPPGRFMMGSPEDEPERDGDELQHEVVLTEGFWLGETACTQKLWQAVMGDNPSHFKGETRPVENVSLENCKKFLEKANELLQRLELRLPTEAEWEYACRAGTVTPFSFGTNITPEQVNYNGSYPYAGGAEGLYREETVPVESLPPNGWGFYEMHGNVYEWCQDWYGDYEEGLAVNPHGPNEGTLRVLRGGSWLDLARFTRSAFRRSAPPDSRDYLIGLRLARGQEG